MSMREPPWARGRALPFVHAVDEGVMACAIALAMHIDGRVTLPIVRSRTLVHVARGRGEGAHTCVALLLCALRERLAFALDARDQLRWR